MTVKVNGHAVDFVNENDGSKVEIINFDARRRINRSGVATEQLMADFLKTIRECDFIIRNAIGWMTYVDLISITALAFRFMMEVRHENVRVLELGSWYGCSSYFWAKSIKAFSDSNILFAMDTWGGTSDVTGNTIAKHSIANYIDGSAHFRGIMNYGGVSQNVKQIMCETEIGMDALADSFFDIVFIDANHAYNAVLNDIYHAVKKLKPDGLLVGHDCENYAGNIPQDLLTMKNANGPDGSAGGYHIGVVMACDYVFGRDFMRAPYSAVWYKRLNQKERDRILKLLAPNKSLHKNLDYIGTLNETLLEAYEFIKDKGMDEAEQIQGFLETTIHFISKLQKAYYNIAHKLDIRACKVSLANVKAEVISYAVAGFFGDNGYYEELRCEILPRSFDCYFRDFDEMMEKPILF